MADNETIWPWIRNALVESAVLHTRILIDILLSRKQDDDDILLRALLPNQHANEKVVCLVKTLRKAYGNRNEPSTACWTFNKMLAHPTFNRTGGFDYTSLVSQLDPVIISLLREISLTADRPSFKHLLSRFLPDVEMSELCRESA